MTEAVIPFAVLLFGAAMARWTASPQRNRLPPLPTRFTLSDPLIAEAAREVDAMLPGSPKIGPDDTIAEAYAALATSAYRLVQRSRQKVFCAAFGCPAMVARSAGTCPRHGGRAE